MRGKTKVISFRINKQEAEFIENLCKQHNLSVKQLILKALKEYEKKSLLNRLAVLAKTINKEVKRCIKV